MRSNRKHRYLTWRIAALSVDIRNLEQQAAITKDRLERAGIMQNIEALWDARCNAADELAALWNNAE